MNLGREVEFRALGKIWRASKMNVFILFQFADWVKGQISSPFAGLDSILDLLPKEEALALVKEAQAKQERLDFLDFTDPWVTQAQQTPRGIMQLMFLLLKAHHPDVTLEQSVEIFMQLGEAQVREILGNAAGQVPEGNPPGPGTSSPGASTGTPSTGG